MHYWRKDSFNKLDALSERLRVIPELANYILYTELLARGLRKDALKHIEDLLSILRSLPIDRQRFIASMLFHEAGYEMGHRLLPDSLHRRFLTPVIEQWKVDEPTNPEPFRWTGILADLIRAVELDPFCDDTRRRLILRILGFVGFSTHELPAGYLGVIEDDYDLLRIARREAELLRDESIKEKFLVLIEDEKKEIDEYKKRRDD